MKNILYSSLILLGLLPLSATAQTDQTSSGRQLPPKSIAALTITATSGIAPGENSGRLFVGTVLNEKGRPLAGVLVSVGPGKDQVTVTNAEGTYMLHSSAAKPLLQLRYAGYEDAELRLSNPQPVTFNLEPISDYKRQLRKQSKAAVKAFYNK
ncbi:hypothetical protein GCM10022408_04160 [Hymenobacter fastidiosus]|uniref:Carboxypeptidase regulatory-like domain-containing protein n=1 Tax=Hymenobacter fastidiosus TaxID=486264 RepID=A0ABP7RFE6_9BACT